MKYVYVFSVVVIGISSERALIRRVGSVARPVVECCLCNILERNAYLYNLQVIHLYIMSKLYTYIYIKFYRVQNLCLASYMIYIYIYIYIRGVVDIVYIISVLSPRRRPGSLCIYPVPTYI